MVQNWISIPTINIYFLNFFFQFLSIGTEAYNHTILYCAADKSLATFPVINNRKFSIKPYIKNNRNPWFQTVEYHILSTTSYANGCKHTLECTYFRISSKQYNTIYGYYSSNEPFIMTTSDLFIHNAGNNIKENWCPNRNRNKQLKNYYQVMI